MPTLSSAVSLASRFSEASHRFLETELARAGHPDLEPCHGDIFAVLFTEDGLTLTELAERSGRSKSTVSVMVRRLTTLGYLEKETNQRDTRALKINLSTEGKKLKPLFLKISESLTANLASELSETELKTLENLLARGIHCLAGSLPLPPC